MAHTIRALRVENDVSHFSEETGLTNVSSDLATEAKLHKNGITMTTKLIIIIIICSISALGIFNIILSIYKMLNMISKLGEYLGIVNNLSNKTRSRKEEDISEEALWVLSNTDVILDIVKSDDYIDSIIELNNYIVNNNSIGIGHCSPKLSREIISWIKKIEREQLATKWQLANPFIWFYRGIELVLKIVLGYPIKQFNPNFDYNGRPWKVVSLIFTLASGLSSIVGLYLAIRR